MIYRNTSRFLPAAESLQLIEWTVSPIVDMQDVAVWVRDTYVDDFHAGFYRRLPAFSPPWPAATRSCRYAIVLGIHPHAKYPHTSRACQEPIYITVASWQEMLVVLAAHEAMHVDQQRKGRWTSEIECERVAAGRLAEWRITTGTQRPAHPASSPAP